MKATSKQISYIEALLKKEENRDFRDFVEAKSIMCGRGDELSMRQASQFIEMLLEPKQEFTYSSRCSRVDGKLKSTVYCDQTGKAVVWDRESASYKEID